MTVTHPDVKAAVPGRGERLPFLSGVAADGASRSTRDFYMRRNLALVVVPDSQVGREWVAEAASARGRAQAEGGEIVIVAPANVSTAGLPALTDADGALAARLGLSDADLPALFLADRYGTVFAATHGADAIPNLRPRDIPGWHEFIACRCS